MIPAELLDLYLSMTDSSRAQTVDTEIARHCAFSLPGVALTMGRKNWTCLKEVYEILASDMQVQNTFMSGFLYTHSCLKCKSIPLNRNQIMFSTCIFIIVTVSYFLPLE